MSWLQCRQSHISWLQCTQSSISWLQCIQSCTFRLVTSAFGRLCPGCNAGYNLEQATKPQTLGYALNDSPAGLLAWIVEKFHTWSDRRGSNGKMPYTKDFLLTNVCLYWLTGNVTSSFRIYYESNYTGDRKNITSKLYCKVTHTLSVGNQFRP